MFSSLIFALFAHLAAAVPAASPEDAYSAAAAAAAWPNGPLVTSGRWILDTTGKNVTYAGANWPGAADTMLPEGLQFQSIETIVSKMKSVGMNAIRLTYAIQMIDEIYENSGKDVAIQDALIKALGAKNGAKILNQILTKNPSFNATTTRLEVFDAVAAECAKQQIYVHLDNHISKAEWCCSTTDGNAWWGDTYFDIANWTRGISYMAQHGKAWPNLMSMSLRNEPREPSHNAAAEKTYNWQGWYKYVRQGADAIHAANPDVLIFLSGLSYDTYLSPVVKGTALTPGTEKFSVDAFAGYSNKIVLELHNYQNSVKSCSSLRSTLDGNGFQAMSDSATLKLPVMMTEFGFQMDASTYKGVYASCLASYLPSIKAGWTIWVLAGSYYIRSGKQDFEEGWGLLNHDWSEWRSPSYVTNQLIPMQWRYEHPVVNTNRFGVFGAPSGTASSAAPAAKDPGNPYNVVESTLVKDLTEDRPSWIFSAYGPGRNAPGQLFGGPQTEQSFEELRLHYYKAAASGNPQAAINDIDNLYRQTQAQFENAIKNPREAVRFVLQAEHQHPNRHDICKSHSLPSTTGEFAVGRNRGVATQATGFGTAAAQASAPSPFGQTPAATQAPGGFGSAFAAPKPAFGQPAGSAFGQPSQLGAGSAFGQPSQPAPPGATSAFGQPSQLGGGGSSAFGQPSALGQKPNPFGAPSLGQPAPAGGGFSKFAQTSAGATGGGAFGQPSQLGGGGAAFGQLSQSTGGGAAFGQASGMGPKPSPFAAAANANTAASHFSNLGNTSSTTPATNAPNAFGRPVASAGNAFGQPSLSQAVANPFATAANAQPSTTPAGGAAAPSPFGQPPAGGTSAPNPFQSAANAQTPFGQPSAMGSTGAFGRPVPQAAVGPPAQSTGFSSGNAGFSMAANGGPSGSGASQQHPPVESYAQHDAAGRLIAFNGQQVSYQVKDGVETPTVRRRDGKPAKIWFPNGPPPYNEETELAHDAYTAEVEAQYATFRTSGKFDVGFMPELPPKREWCLWNF
ncbi:Glycoside hydrolase, subgroup, catalytic core [Niveomyces insectorum RCEF 264]|uniref:Glycoside hydrolase, subgroup, catalytic core n=1 Tax=Niveomyces insectorum RCEF 264 TaxID=1081102 RepID=A0A167XSZ0_9HYPO|nr:Glycoside hydrolase, subgroup, catalytic core [Niveomyces insectorum RCEF 264]